MTDRQLRTDSTVRGVYNHKLSHIRHTVEFSTSYVLNIKKYSSAVKLHVFATAVSRFCHCSLTSGFLLIKLKMHLLFEFFEFRKSNPQLLKRNSWRTIIVDKFLG